MNPSTGAYTSSIRTPTGIPADPALTSHGVKQAEELGHHLMTLDPPIEAVYSSPYYRCLQTIYPFVDLQRQQQLRNASETCCAPATTIRPDYGLCEWFGSAPFEHPSPAAPQKLKAMFPAYDCDYVSALAPSRRGETVAELYDRVERAVQSIIQACDAQGMRAIVLCTHAAVVIALGRVLTGRIPQDVETEDFGAFTCGLSAYRRRTAQGTGAGTDGSSTSVYQVAGIAESREMDYPTDTTGVLTNPAAAVSGWDCVLDSDCSFLSSGAERGW